MLSIFFYIDAKILNLSFDGGFIFLIFRGGWLNLSIPFLFVKTIEKVIRLLTVLKFFFPIKIKVKI